MSDFAVIIKKKQDGSRKIFFFIMLKSEWGNDYLRKKFIEMRKIE